MVTSHGVGRASRRSAAGEQGQDDYRGWSRLTSIRPRCFLKPKQQKSRLPTLLHPGNSGKEWFFEFAPEEIVSADDAGVADTASEAGLNVTCVAWRQSAAGQINCVPVYPPKPTTVTLTAPALPAGLIVSDAGATVSEK